MSGAEKRNSNVPPARNPAPNDTAADPGESGGFIVARGRTVHVDGQAIKPGQAVELSPEDAEWLQARGFIVPAESLDAAGGGVAVGGLRINGGRKPGGVVPR